ncbi:MAG: hypothetical protein HWD81_03590, partial [Marivivens sp.]|nr:hypothetical protein [Marivivens sp.]
MTLINDLIAARQAVTAVGVTYLVPAVDIGNAAGTSVFIWEEPSLATDGATDLFVALVDADDNVIPQGTQAIVGIGPTQT